MLLFPHHRRRGALAPTSDGANQRVSSAILLTNAQSLSEIVQFPQH
jgi:hypothetical protein